MECRESSLVFFPIGFEKFPGAKAGIWFILFVFGKVRALLYASQEYRQVAWRSRVYGVSRLLETQVTRHLQTLQPGHLCYWARGMLAWHFPEHTAHLERLAFETNFYN